MLQFISGGVCAPKGFAANGVHCGIRKNKIKKDLALITSEVRCTAACVYTQNLVKGAPILVTKEHVKDGYARAVIVNSGNANTCNANGVEIAEKMCSLVEEYTGIPAGDVVVASTGVIGQELRIDPIAGGMEELTKGLASDEAHSSFAAEAIMTTDTVKKETAVSFTLGGKEVRLGVICKGVGMICPNMATMLMFLTTDAAITHEMLQKAVSADVKDSLNMLSVDRDTSTNDTLCILASGLAGNPVIDAEGEDFDIFCGALHTVTTEMCKKLAADGEGATRLAAKSVVNSNLVKAMIFGADANGGRVMCALGYAGADLDPMKIDVDFRSEAGTLPAYKQGSALPFSEDFAKRVLSEKEIVIDVDLNGGDFEATAWGCDLTYDYVKINGDYRT